MKNRGRIAIAGESPNHHSNEPQVIHHLPPTISTALLSTKATLDSPTHTHHLLKRAPKNRFPWRDGDDAEE